jgi:hypothetical protein
MCVVSMVYDHYNQQLPYTWPQTWEVPTELPVEEIPVDLAKALKDFRKAKEAAEEVDKLTGQKDCVDPEKQKLEERVKELEALLAKQNEIVILTGGMVEPGTYRVIDGKLYRLVTQ